jgi:hypothetical protein
MRFLTLISALFFLASGVATYAQSREGSAFATEKTDIAKTISVYPNPATNDYVYVKLDVLKAEKVKLTLHNIIGNEIATETEVVSEHEVRVRIKDLASGYYLLAVREDEAKFRGTYKFLKR